MMYGEELLICNTCGTQFDVPYCSPLKSCRICDVSISCYYDVGMSRFAFLPPFQDPRQYVPPGGQVWSSLAKLKGRHENHFEQDPTDERVWFITTEPKVSCHCIVLVCLADPTSRTGL